MFQCYNCCYLGTKLQSKFRHGRYNGDIIGFDVIQVVTKFKKKKQPETNTLAVPLTSVERSCGKYSFKYFLQFITQCTIECLKMIKERKRSKITRIDS